jgi:hypothetical protein
VVMEDVGDQETQYNPSEQVEEEEHYSASCKISFVAFVKGIPG